MQARILSALIVEVPITAISITPNMLNPGVNVIKLRFSNVGGLKPNRTYNIRFFLDNGVQVTVPVVYVK